MPSCNCNDCGSNCNCSSNCKIIIKETDPGLKKQNEELKKIIKKLRKELDKNNKSNKE